MRSTPMIVLCAALVHSIFGTASDDTADHSTMRNTNIIRPIHLYAPSHSKENKERTNIAIDLDYRLDYDIPKDHPIITDLEIHRRNIRRFNIAKRGQYIEDSFFNDNEEKIRVKRQEVEDPKCEGFSYTSRERVILSPKDSKSKTYPNNTNCVTIINATDSQTIRLTFVDVFHIEDHPDCAYDYLEIRDGFRGYADLLGKYCGESFPPQIITSGPSVWLKFHSDDTIEYSGFHINVEFVNGPSRSIPDECYIEMSGTSGIIDSEKITPECLSKTSNQNLDVLWKIETEPKKKIYLNFTKYSLKSPNECEQNVIQVFGYLLEYEAKFAQYCGSVAEAISTKGDSTSDNSNIMYVRMYASKASRDKTVFVAQYTAYKVLDPTKDEKCDETEFDCEDNTCIDIGLVCDHYANCRLKTDEEASCFDKAESMLNQPHIQVVLVIFSLILSGMSFVFLFRCIRKLYQDHKIIKEHIRQSCEDRLDSLVASRLTLDAKKLQRDSEPRASLERDNHTNEMYKKQRILSNMKPSSIDSDYIQETQLDVEDEAWRRDVECVPEIIETEDIRIERNGKARRSDLSRREESMRSKTKERDEVRGKKEIRDVSVGAPDTKESGCQTRESLFQVESPQAPSSDGSGSNSRGFSTFGYSGTTIVRPSPPAPSTNTSQITIELLKQASQESKKKIPDRRPMSNETTRSAPDVIIVSKPLR